MKVSDSIYTNGNWLIKSDVEEEMMMPTSKDLYSEAAFFHFRHWDDFLSNSVSTNYQNKIISSIYDDKKKEENNCMVSVESGYA